MNEAAIIAGYLEFIKGRNLEDTRSVHIDEFLDLENCSLHGLDLIHFLMGILKVINRFFIEESHMVPKFIGIYIPVGTSKNIAKWRPSIVERLKISSEPPSIFTTNEDKFLDLDATEEYLYPFINIDSHGSCNINHLYRSFRSKIHTENKWEFCNAIYLYIKKK